ncbi:MAG: amidohydrolase, partial [Gemmataceae bacterium]
MKTALAIALIFLGFVKVGMAAPPVAAADLVLRNGKIWTNDPNNAAATALAASHGRILAVGDDARILELVGPKTTVIDLQGRRVVPGFYDSHLHFLGGGRFLSQVDLKDCSNAAEFASVLKKFVENLSRERWILGGNWDHDRAFAGKLPTAAMLDTLTEGRPAFLRRYDGHMALANTEALKRAGITSSTVDPPGGVIERGPDGKTPTGILKDNAMDLVDKFIPEPDETEIREAVRAAMMACAKNGITSVQDMEGSSAATRKMYFHVLQELAAQRELTVRVDVRWPIAEAGALLQLGVMANFGNDFVRIGGVKGYMDGSLGSSTAKMVQPYLSQPVTGVYVTEPDRMRGLIRNADQGNLSVGIHAIGDQANAVLLDLFQERIEQNPARDRRFRIEHAQHLRAT